MAIPVNVQTFFTFENATSAAAAGMVAAPGTLFPFVFGDPSFRGLAKFDTLTNSYTGPASNTSAGGVCTDGSSIWTAEQDLGSVSGFGMEFAEWNTATLLPTTRFTVPSSVGNGRTSGDCVAWAGKIWQMINVVSIPPFLAQLVANDLTTLPQLPALLPPDMNASSISKMLVANGHLYYFLMLGTVSGGEVVYLAVDDATLIATSLPSNTSPTRPTAVLAIAFDGVDLWVTLPTVDMVAKVSTAGAVLGTFSTDVPANPTQIAVDFTGNIWVGSGNFPIPTAINVAVFDPTMSLIVNEPYGVNQEGIQNIFSDDFSKSIWVAYSDGTFFFAVDQYQYPAASTSGRFHGTFVGFMTAGQFGAGNQ